MKQTTAGFANLMTAICQKLTDSFVLAEHYTSETGASQGWNLHIFKQSQLEGFDVESYWPLLPPQQPLRSHLTERGLHIILQTVTQPQGPSTNSFPNTALICMGILRSKLWNQPFYFSSREIAYQRRKLVLELVDWYRRN
eukprot:gb/GECG01002376.1/.p1 GENE.gb/GECG01002376.1/~~gb/GECG01002376.1/.p1  ORF type:complete len:140 (+),score=8.73 gb/GECG01002376.1/:1-420(+)